MIRAVMSGFFTRRIPTVLILAVVVTLCSAYCFLRNMGGVEISHSPSVNDGKGFFLGVFADERIKFFEIGRSEEYDILTTKGFEFGYDLTWPENALSKIAYFECAASPLSHLVRKSGIIEVAVEPVTIIDCPYDFDYVSRRQGMGSKYWKWWSPDGQYCFWGKVKKRDGGVDADYDYFCVYDSENRNWLLAESAAKNTTVVDALWVSDKELVVLQRPEGELGLVLERIQNSGGIWNSVNEISFWKMIDFAPLGTGSIAIGSADGVTFVGDGILRNDHDKFKCALIDTSNSIIEIESQTRPMYVFASKDRLKIICESKNYTNYDVYGIDFATGEMFRECHLISSASSVYKFSQHGDLLACVSSEPSFKLVGFARVQSVSIRSIDRNCNEIMKVLVPWNPSTWARFGTRDQINSIENALHALFESIPR